METTTTTTVMTSRSAAASSDMTPKTANHRAGGAGGGAATVASSNQSSFGTTTASSWSGGSGFSTDSGSSASSSSVVGMIPRDRGPGPPRRSSSSIGGGGGGGSSAGSGGSLPLLREHSPLVVPDVPTAAPSSSTPAAATSSSSRARGGGGRNNFRVRLRQTIRRGGLASSSSSDDSEGSELADDRDPLLAARADAARAGGFATSSARQYKTGRAEPRLVGIRSSSVHNCGDDGGDDDRRDGGKGGKAFRESCRCSRLRVISMLILLSSSVGGLLFYAVHNQYPMRFEGHSSKAFSGGYYSQESMQERVAQLEALYTKEKGGAAEAVGAGTMQASHIDETAEGADANTEKMGSVRRRKHTNMQILEQLKEEEEVLAKLQGKKGKGKLAIDDAMPPADNNLNNDNENGREVDVQANAGDDPAAVALAIANEQQRLIQNDNGVAAAGGDASPATVAYVLPVFTCYPPTNPENPANFATAAVPVNDDTFHDAALLLKATIHRNSAQNPNSGSRYNYEMIALVHPDVVACGKEGGSQQKKILEGLGYDVRVINQPVMEHEIESEYIRKHVNMDLDGGLRELIRLEAFGMADKAVAVLVDLNTVILRPTDDVFDLILNGGDDPANKWMDDAGIIVKDTFYRNGTLVTQPSVPDDLEVAFVRDYTSVIKGRPAVGIGLSFLALRPSKETYNALVDLYKKSIYVKKHGWDSNGYFGYPGAMTTRGLLTYYYNEIKFGRKVELHRCTYGNMAEDPLVMLDREHRMCRDVKERRENEPDPLHPHCVDCRLKPFEEIVVANLAVCRPPWSCHYHDESSHGDGGKDGEGETTTAGLCRRLHGEWYKLRRELEDRWLPFGKGDRSGQFHPNYDLGYCKNWGRYVPMVRPAAEGSYPVGDIA